MKQQIYNNLPVWSQNVACSLYGYKEKSIRYGKLFEEKLRFLRESQWFSSGEIEAYQNEQLQGLIKHVYQSVPYYRDLFKDKGLHPQDILTKKDLQKLPVLTKETVRQHWERMVSSEFYGKKYLSHTSGSTGKALDFYLSKDSIEFQWAVWWRFRERFGVRPGDRSLNFTGKLAVPIEQKRPPFWRFNQPFNQYIVNMQHIKEENASYFVDFINDGGFKFFSGYPSIIYRLAEIIQALNLNITNGPEIIMTGAESLYENQKKTIEEVFKCLVVDQYGFSEGAGNASKCELKLFHEDFEFGILEDTQSEIITTGFANYAMPFIRYEVGDTASWTHKKCGCGRQSRTINKIEGRTEDYVMTPEGTKILRFDYLFKNMEQIVECQVIQRKMGEVVFAIVPRPDFSLKDERVLRRLVSEWISPTIVVKIEKRTSIKRTTTGKFKAVVSEL
ncbi:phenylacetate--CoA ligase family protein [Roseivirga sp. E12]|uniref:phenylacetate--CoA ligase family protein n=1 Tax=Roseivirga sp. E12 TaxID=2819237 RepID=UPI001ABC15B4|nr:phenylacetate--CoA ligase family protein [Roseivirga sp. E12]MBO3699746.1 phenylacetate--CoA ligase family protein [Roseivirga sp. E12]